MPLVRHKIKRYGWVSDTPDQRDHLYTAPVVQLKRVPPKVDMEGAIASDSGAQIRDGIKSVAKLGECPKTDRPYYIA